MSKNDINSAITVPCIQDAIVRLWAIIV